MSRPRSFRNPEQSAWNAFSRALGRDISRMEQPKPVVPVREKRDEALRAWLKLWNPSPYDCRFLQ